MKRSKSLKLFQNPIVSGIVLCMVFAVVLTAFAAGLLLSGVLPQTVIRETGVVCSSFAALLGCLISLNKAQNKKMIYVLCIWIGYLLLLTLGNLLFLKDRNWNILPILLSTGAGAIIGGILTIAGKKRNKRRTW